MSRNYITYDGKDLRDYGVYISGSGVYNAPTRVYDNLTIPGRSGMIVGNEKRLDNIELVYPAFIYRDFKSNVSGLRNFMLSRVGYKRLEDTYHPDEYRLATFEQGLDVEPTDRQDAGRFELIFNCKPQRYLKSGELTITVTQKGTVIHNPSMFPAYPWVRVYGAGYLYVGSTETIIYHSVDHVDIDGETMEASEDGHSMNQFVEAITTDMVRLDPWDNVITWSSFISQVDIIPRWWIV